MTARVPNPAYPAKDGSALYGDKGLYARIENVAEQDGGKKLVEEFEIPIRSGKAWVVKKGEFSRDCVIAGPGEETPHSFDKPPRLSTLADLLGRTAMQAFHASWATSRGSKYLLTPQSSRKILGCKD